MRIRKNKKKTIKIICFIITMILMCNNSLSQNRDVLCSKKFKSVVYQILLDLNEDTINISFNGVKLIFEIQVNEEGKIICAQIVKSNLRELDIKIEESDILSLIEGKNFPCIREIYYQGELLPNKVVLILKW